MRASLTACVVLFLLSTALFCNAANSSGNGAAAPASRPADPNLTIPYPTDVLTYHYNVYRQGATLQETTLTPSNVNSTSFGKVGFFSVDGKVDAQPLYVNKQFIGGSLNNTVYVVTGSRQRLRFQRGQRHGNSGGSRYWAAAKLPAIITAATRFRRRSASPTRR